MSRPGRRRILALALAVSSLALGVASSATDAAGQSAAAPRPKSAPDAGDRYDPDDVTAISQFMETLGKGNDKYAAKDFAGAIDVYKKAIQLNPRSALGPYLLGEGYLATNNLGEAEAAFKTAEELNDAKLPLVRSNVLFAVADVYEREKKWDLARAAWQAYAEHAGKLGADSGAHPGSGAARLKAVDDWLKLDKQYEVVRQRIAAEKADAGAKPPRAATPPKKK